MIRRTRTLLLRCLLYGVLGIIVVVFVGAQVIIHYSPAPTVITCRGSAREMGRAYGDQLALSTKLLIKGYLERGICRNNPDIIQQRYAASSRVLEHLSEPYATELNAIATASDCDINGLMYGNCFLDLGNARAGCRSVVINVDNGLLHAHNLDWDNLGGMARWTTTVIRRAPSDGRLKTVAVAFPGMIGAPDIINSEGIAMSFNQLGYGNSVPSEPVFIMIRRIAETSKTFDEAQRKILNAPDGMPFLITLSSALEGRAAIYERLGAEIEVRNARGGWVAGCNVAQKQGVGQTLLDETIIKRDPGDLTSLKHVLGHPQVLADNNLYSVIFDFHNNALYLASGKVPAAKEPYRKLPLF